MSDNKRKNRWYFGGLASACAVAVTHPLDLIKVQFQVQQKPNLTISRKIKTIFITEGIRGFYHGLTAAIGRQLTYATTRFGVYEIGKSHINQKNLIENIALATFAGVCGGIIGMPTDIVNIRMQGDTMLPPGQRRKYKNVFDGLYRIATTEGLRTLYNGGSIAISRAILLTIGQIVVYERLKSYFFSRGYEDNMPTHFMSSCGSATLAIFITHPLDVVKTRIMNAKRVNGTITIVIKGLMKEAPFSFYKGILPSFLRIGPQTILTFLIMEQMRLQYGYLPSLTPASSSPPLPCSSSPNSYDSNLQTKDY